MDLKLRNSRYTEVFETKQGKEVLEDLVKTFHINSTTYRKDGNINDVVFREGQRSVVLFILSQINNKEK